MGGSDGDASTYGDLLLRNDNGTALSSYTNRGDVGCSDCLESIFLRAVLVKKVAVMEMIG